MCSFHVKSAAADRNVFLLLLLLWSRVTLSRQCMHWPCQRGYLFGELVPYDCNSGWLRRQAESNPGPLAWQARTVPVHQGDHLIGKASTYAACSPSFCYIIPAKSVFILEHRAQSAPSGFWPPRSCCTTWKVHTVRSLTVSSTRPFG